MIALTNEEHRAPAENRTFRMFDDLAHLAHLDWNDEGQATIREIHGRLMLLLGAALPAVELRSEVA